MLYIQRGADGAYCGLTTTQGENTEPFDEHNPEMQAFLQTTGLDVKTVQEQNFTASDLTLIRVLEDLIDALVNKGVLRMTDLPMEALSKLTNRNRLRKQMGKLENLMGDE